MWMWSRQAAWVLQSARGGQAEEAFHTQQHRPGQGQGAGAVAVTAGPASRAPRLGGRCLLQTRQHHMEVGPGLGGSGEGLPSVR